MGSASGDDAGRDESDRNGRGDEVGRGVGDGAGGGGGGASGFDDDALVPPVPPVPPGVLGGPDLTSELDRWVADARAEEAARARSRQRGLHTSAQEDGSLLGVLVDLGERGAAVSVATTSGRSHQGVIRLVGEDYVLLATERGEVVVAVSGLAAVRGAPGVAPSAGVDLDAAGHRLADLLVALAAERERVVLVASGGDAVRGELAWVARDVVAVRGDDERRSTTYVPLASIIEVTRS